MRIRIPDEWFGLYLPALRDWPAFPNVSHRTLQVDGRKWAPRLVSERARRLADENAARRLLSGWPYGWQMME